MKARHRRAGVALLEMMIALILMGLISVMIASALGFQGRSRSVLDRWSAGIAEGLARNALRHWAASIPLSAVYIGADPERRFVGEADTLRFTTFMPDGPFWAGDPVFVQVLLADDGRLLARAEGTHAESRGPLTRDEVLATDASGLRLRYYGRLKLRDRPDWHDAWDGRARLPDLVRIETDGAAFVPLALEPGLSERQRFISRSSLVPPARPSRP